METKEAIAAVIKEDGLDSAIAWVAGIVDEKHSRIERLEETIEVMQYQIKELQWNLECKDDLHQQDYERLRNYQIALSNISKMTMCMAVSYADLAQKQKDIARSALGEKNHAHQK